MKVIATMVAAASLAVGPASAEPAAAPAVDGPWSGAVVRRNAVQRIDVRLASSDDGPNGTYDIPELALFDEPLRELAITDGGLALRILYGPFALRHHPELGQLTGGNERWNPPLALHLKREPAPPERPFVTEAVQFASGDVKLKGLLVRPRAGGPAPALVAVHGSGEQGLEMWEYRSHAYALARRGVAVLLYDKRGVGGSTGDYRKADFETLAGDAAAAARWLRTRPGVLPSAVGLLGISQGGWISAVAAQRGAEPAFVVLLQGPAVSLEQQELHRVEYGMRADGLDRSAIDAALEHTRTYFEFVNTSRGWEKLAASSEAAATSAWADWVHRPEAPDDEGLLWWRRSAYDPAEDLERMKCPVLAIFGEDDTVVPPAENLRRMESHLASAGVPHATVVVADLPHAVTTHQQLRGGEWNWPDAFWVWPHRPAALDEAIVDWVMRYAKPASSRSPSSASGSTRRYE